MVGIQESAQIDSKSVTLIEETIGFVRRQSYCSVTIFAISLIFIQQGMSPCCRKNNDIGKIRTEHYDCLRTNPIVRSVSVTLFESNLEPFVYTSFHF